MFRGKRETPVNGTSATHPPTTPIQPSTYTLYLEVHNRNELSLGDSRRRLGFSAYHWTILLSDKENKHFHVYDVTDGSSPDCVTREPKPDHEWTYRARNDVDPDTCESRLVRMTIGEVRAGLGPEIIKGLLQSVPLPVKGAVPEQSCVTWTKVALCKLRAHGYARWIGDVEMLVARALAYADLRLADPKDSVGFIDYLGNQV
ncbi:uncharacterized protein N7515_002458 [Penicillium bovifimosum]|uniref:Uncharacterized protein n=1 Tax=Penicillium bovifimosum TaxID=126998 RepID=A0A9W9L9D7_9EURO|nr:uncharacterized protein N7515_002458 [Penicillium bovifimosum]KAJ5143671.1 hypothetical protein N7515_002458 [Penicillium bovifimosum]